MAPNTDGTVWATSSRLLAGFHGGRLDIDHLVRRLAPADVGIPDTTSTYFSGISRVPVGHLVTMSPSGQTTTRPVWAPTNSTPEDHASQLHRALDSAVTARLDEDEVPSDFSGGFDSTGLALLCAERLGRLGKQLPAITVHPAGTTAGGDMDYAREAADHPAIRHIWLPCTSTESPYSALDQVPPADEPASSTCTYAAFARQLRLIQQETSSQIHITGDGGDTLLSTPVVHIRDLG